MDSIRDLAAAVWRQRSRFAVEHTRLVSFAPWRDPQNGLILTLLSRGGAWSVSAAVRTCWRVFSHLAVGSPWRCSAQVLRPRPVPPPPLPWRCSGAPTKTYVPPYCSLQLDRLRRHEMVAGILQPFRAQFTVESLKAPGTRVLHPRHHQMVLPRVKAIGSISYLYQGSSSCPALTPKGYWRHFPPPSPAVDYWSRCPPPPPSLGRLHHVEHVVRFPRWVAIGGLCSPTQRQSQCGTQLIRVRLVLINPRSTGGLLS
jgi:hypothetical protein